jgi:hypothetical protein
MTKLLPSMQGRLPDDIAVADFTLTLACYASPKVPWSTEDTHICASLLTTIWLTALEARGNKLWSALEVVLKERIKPLFAKTPNPAITAAGRKNFHPQSVPSFDSMDESTKPWKTTDVYVGPALLWMIEQYTVCHSTTSHHDLRPLNTDIDSSPRTRSIWKNTSRSTSQPF